MTNESARIILLQMLDGLDPTTGVYWITAKAAEKFKLPKVLGRAFPK